MNDPTRIGTALEQLPDAPTELVTATDGSKAPIQWQGTPVTGEWVTNYVNALIAARLVEAWQLGGSEAQTAAARAANRDRLTAWHQALAGLPREGLEAAREHFLKHGLEDKRWHLRPTDISRWVRARARRVIPPGQECEAHPEEWEDRCAPCRQERLENRHRTPSILAGIRRELAQRKDPA